MVVTDTVEDDDNNNAYDNYIASPTEDNYKELLVRLKQMIGARGLKKVSLADYVHRKIEFDPEIYEKKILTDYGIRYTYVKQGTNPVLTDEGTYITTDSLLVNYDAALEKGYRETAPFRVRWNGNNTDNHITAFNFHDTTAIRANT